MSKTELIEDIKASGCDMLAGKIDGTETKSEIVEYLKHCDCPVLKSHYVV